LDSVFLFDLDGTITRNELLPLIGKQIGLYDELAKLTDDTMQGKIPFDQSFKHRVNLLGRVKLSEVQEIVLDAPCFDELLNWIKQNREKAFIVTGNLDVWVQPWLDKHKLIGFKSESEFIDKSYSVRKILRKESILRNFPDKRLVMIGDGANDARIMELCDIGIASEMTHKISPILWEHANYVLKDEVLLCRLLTRLL
jgi:phosphoserine phosphatase